MTVTTIRAATPPREARSLPHQISRHATSHETVGFVAVAATAAIVGATGPAAAFALLVAAATGSWIAAATVLTLSIPFVAITIPTMAIWLLGVIETRRAVRRLHASKDRRRRDAIDRTDVRAWTG